MWLKPKDYHGKYFGMRKQIAVELYTGLDE